MSSESDSLVGLVERVLDRQEGTPYKIRMHPLDIQVLQWGLVEGVKRDDLYGSNLLGVKLEPDCAVMRGSPQVDVGASHTAE